MANGFEEKYLEYWKIKVGTKEAEQEIDTKKEVKQILDYGMF